MRLCTEENTSANGNIFKWFSFIKKIICDIKPSITAEALEFRRTVTGWNKWPGDRILAPSIWCLCCCLVTQLSAGLGYIWWILSFSINKASYAINGLHLWTVLRGRKTHVLGKKNKKPTNALCSVSHLEQYLKYLFF